MIPRIADLNQALVGIQSGQVLAYPTEAVFGLGCDAFNQSAVERIMLLKRRSVDQGVIVLIADWPQLFGLIGEFTIAGLDRVKATWPGPVTWVFPKADRVPAWLSGSHPTIAVRMSAHPIAQKLCQYGPIVSTSANPHGQAPARSLREVEQLFQTGLDGIVVGDLGTETQPSAMFDVCTNQQLR